MAGVYPELRALVLAHRKCAGPAEATRVYPAPLATVCASSAAAGWVTPDDADEDLLRSALLAFEN
jgi:hypothetical protein